MHVKTCFAYFGSPLQMQNCGQVFSFFISKECKRQTKVRPSSTIVVKIALEKPESFVDDARVDLTKVEERTGSLGGISYFDIKVSLAGKRSFPYLSLSLTHTHIHTHTHFVSLSFIYHTHTHSHSSSLFLTLYQRHTHTLSLSLSYSRTHTHSNIHTLFLSRTHSLSLTHTHTHTLLHLLSKTVEVASTV